MVRQPQPHNRCSVQRPQRGVALLMVVFMIALASALLISLTDSTYVAMRLNSAAEHRIKAEYILKSAVSVAQVLLKTDITSYDDPQQDAWMAFADGREVPGDMLGLTEPNIRVTLMIASKSGKIPLAKVWQVGSTDTTWRDIVTALFRNLGFDTPAPNTNTSSSAPFVNAEEMVANLIDYLDPDQTNYQQNGFASGVEANLPDDVQFRNDKTIDSLASELASIPGFTPGRIQKILPFVFVSTTSVRNEVNLNAAPYEVVAAMTDSTPAVKLLACRQNQGPFKNVVSDLQNCGVTITDPKIFSVSGTLYEVIAKVEYGTAAFMASAELKSTGSGNSGKLPTITNFQVY